MSMRISTSTFHDVGYRSIAKNQTELLRLQNQFSTGKRINSAADDPVGAMQASELNAAKSVNDQYERNQLFAQNSLGFLDGIVGDMDDVMQSMRETLVAVGNGTLSPTDKKNLGVQLRSKLDELLRLANTRDESGRHIFAGFSDANAPFSLVGGILTYQGDNGVRQLPVSATTNVPLNISGSELFLDVRTGNGVIQTAAATGNTGTGLINGGNVVNAAALTDDNFEVRIRDVSGTLVYDVVNTTTSTTLINGATYTPGASIAVGPALSVSVSGTPANGDFFSIGPAQTQNVFQSIDRVIRSIEDFAAGKISNAALTDQLRIATTNLDQSYERVLTVRNRFGNVMQELERQADINSRKDIELQTRISEIVDVNTVEAVSELTKTQAALEASQALYSTIAKRNLFDYL
ncbi:MAG: flagellar hook-associated protein FlgL [bacterium]|jgi:flagellar hook-associated protein 3 FlgL